MGVQVDAMPSATKLRGGYYTPRAVADWLAAQALESKPRRVLEPSAGDGALVRALLPKLASNATLDAVEVDRVEADKLRELAAADPRLHVHEGDAFTWFGQKNRASRASYDVVLGNPPYVRYQHWANDQSDRAFALMRDEGLRPNRLTNAWLPFVILASVALKPGGHLALVLPAELLQVGYAGELRQYLSKEFDEITLVTFKELIFPDILQETVLLLARKRTKTSVVSRIRTVEVRNGGSLGTAKVNLREEDLAELDHSTEKWTKYFLTAREVGFLRDAAHHPGLVKLGELADIDVGIVTGRNEVFVLTASQASAAGVERYCRPLVGRSAQVPGVALTAHDWTRLRDEDSRVLLLDLPNVAVSELPAAAAQYVAEAEARRQHTGYKCRIRMPNWWALPSTWAPAGYLLRQIYDGPRLILNRADATCTDTLHKVRFRVPAEAEAVTTNLLNSVTWALAEVRGRSYGGGVLELEPSEAEALLMPAPKFAAVDVGTLDDIVRRKGNAVGVDEVDARVLVEQCGWTTAEVALARQISEKLAQRRLGRKRSRQPD